MGQGPLLVYVPGARFVVEGVRTADGTFHVTALFQRVRATRSDVERPMGDAVKWDCFVWLTNLDCGKALPLLRSSLDLGRIPAAP